jgi:hypothetical protein
VLASAELFKNAIKFEAEYSCSVIGNCSKVTYDRSAVRGNTTSLQKGCQPYNYSLREIEIFTILLRYILVFNGAASQYTRQS